MDVKAQYLKVSIRHELIYKCKVTPIIMISQFFYVYIEKLTLNHISMLHVRISMMFIKRGIVMCQHFYIFLAIKAVMY